ncbi:LacI family DNA-binding transcriptional regulator [Paenibacillus flagellatus]|uniref:HTH lacI-type domain-containing protein n=1 Tax=Paenibacillus flagellatus TaxID=2211139 RepID=A0A2V5JWG7_9BACL|nr:LacI family DNA-binding transcriptional regulator [Paenibacillus flagellatus]PYI51119.1 hypothetical protein DLM86_25855 [Paenibacillus flagellatus]
MPIRKQVKLETIAASLGLSVQTVSKALRGKPGMSHETRRLVVEKARELGYLTREQLQQLSVDRIAVRPPLKRRFVLIHTTQSVNYNRLLLEGLNERIAEIGHTIDPLLIPERLKEAELDDWIGDRELHYCEGIFIAPSLHPPATEQRLLRLPLPRILFNFPAPGAETDSVIWDVYTAVALSVRHLAETGHRRILYVGDIKRQRGFFLRWQAFIEAMGYYGLPFREEDHLTASRSGTSQWAERLADKLERLRPDAVVVGVDDDVVPAYRVIAAAGFDVPKDVSIIGMLNEQRDGTPLFTRPQLLIRETGYRAAERMLWRIANPTMPYEHIRIQGPLFVGHTTRARD